MPSHWLELSIKAGPDVQDPVSSFLVEQGSTGLIYTDQTMRAFFPSTEKDAAVRKTVRLYLKRLRDIFPERPMGRARWRVIADKNWHDAWRKYFKIQRTGRFLIAPPWLAPQKSNRQIIVIEPAMAFGTGTHETTRCCLEFIDALRSPPRAALDVGTGSGILAIALAKMGVRDVLALDNDPVALEAAELNVRLNNVEDAVTLSGAGLARMRRRFPLVMANIMLETLVQLSAPLTRCVAPGGNLVLAGLLRAQVPPVLERFEDFTIEQRKDRKEWSTLLLRKLP